MATMPLEDPARARASQPEVGPPAPGWWRRHIASIRDSLFTLRDAHAGGPRETPEQEDARLAAETRQVLQRELEWLGLDDSAGRAGQAQDGLAALCLSGGGIRSASFCLGVLQGLAERKALDKFHFLSTVSGGGYIGSWLAAWMHREGQQGVIRQLADGPAPASASAAQAGCNDPEPTAVRRLRSYTNYLSPVWGLSTDFLSLVATFVRNLAINWVVLVPLIAAVLMLPRAELAMVNLPPIEVPPWAYFGAMSVAALFTVLTIAYIVADLPYGVPRQPPKNRFVPLCFFPLILAAILLSWVLAWDPATFTQLIEVGDAPDADAGRWFLIGVGACLQLLATALGGIARRLRKLDGAPLTWFEAAVSIASGGAGGWLLHALASRIDTLGIATPAGRELYATLSVPVLFLVFWAACTLYTALMSARTDEHQREWWARATAWWLGAGLAWLAAFVLVVDAPRWLLSWQMLHGGVKAPVAAGAGAALVGVLTSAIGYWSKNGAKIRKEAQGLLEATGVRLMNVLSLASILALAVGMSIAVSCTLRWSDDQLAETVRHAQQHDYERLWAANWAPVREHKPVDPRAAPIAVRAHVAYGVVLSQSSPLQLVEGLVLLVLFGLLASHFAGVNTFSLHNMYGNRLARAFLGASNPERHPHWFTGFDPADNPPLAAVGDRTADPEGPVRKCLLPVINVALNIVKPVGGRLEWQQRMAASFTMTPLHCGSRALGFVETEHYGARPEKEGVKGGLSLGRAMAISGAAASPNMGYHTSKLVAFVMTFFNVRLGWWTPNTVPRNQDNWQEREPFLGVTALLDEALATTATSRSFVYLSDGGHFENLGLYEMVRRGCTRIVVVDASCDPNDEFEDLEGAIRKVRVDFGVEITFDEPLPATGNASVRKRYIAVGHIAYPGREKPGDIVYIKPVLTGKEPLDITRFAAQNNRKGKAFPHQPTSDQFFNESQFESYRALGQCAVLHSFAAWEKDWKNWPEAEPLKEEQAQAIRTRRTHTRMNGMAELLNLARRSPDERGPGEPRA